MSGNNEWKPYYDLQQEELRKAYYEYLAAMCMLVLGYFLLEEFAEEAWYAFWILESWEQTGNTLQYVYMNELLQNLGGSLLVVAGGLVFVIAYMDERRARSDQFIKKYWQDKQKELDKKSS
ncbi:MAG: hypothetical protein WDZ94_01385 [Patescibacteria group bacterium]